MVVQARGWGDAPRYRTAKAVERTVDLTVVVEEEDSSATVPSWLMA